jgi:hypothetical protein
MPTKDKKGVSNNKIIINILFLPKMRQEISKKSVPLPP